VFELALGRIGRLENARSITAFPTGPIARGEPPLAHLDALDRNTRPRKDAPPLGQPPSYRAATGRRSKTIKSNPYAT
jgi:hypothetical protein